MLMNNLRTALINSIVLVVAVFFSGSSVVADDSSLYSLESSLNNLIYDVSRSVVTIEASSTLPGDVSSAMGVLSTLVSSGLLVDTNGHVLVSAYSVVDYDRFEVVFENRRIEAKLVGIDYFHDVALLTISCHAGHPVEMSDNHSCAGKMVVALGNSYGVRATPSLGFCAGVRPDGTLQFTIPFSSGATGGGVFDLNGNLLGMISGAVGDEDRVAIAIPSHKLQSIVDYLITRGSRLAGFIGITTSDIEISPPVTVSTDQQLFAASVSTAEELTRGTIIATVMPQFPASKAGLEPGDIVLAVEGSPISSSLELATLVRLHNPGKVLHFDILRQNNRMRIPVEISIKPLGRLKRALLEESYSSSPLTTDSLSKIVNYLFLEIGKLEKKMAAQR